MCIVLLYNVFVRSKTGIVGSNPTQGMEGLQIFINLHLKVQKRCSEKYIELHS
jgi:hypothetical protein